MNYVEVIASWYLRLNGFFVLDGFVVHNEARPGQASDWDVLGVRFPHTFEVVGGQEGDWDMNHLFAPDLLDLGCTIGVLCEVKTGRPDGDPFRADKVLYGLRRFGFIERPGWRVRRERYGSDPGNGFSDRQGADRPQGEPWMASPYPCSSSFGR